MKILSAFLATGFAVSVLPASSLAQTILTGDHVVVPTLDGNNQPLDEGRLTVAGPLSVEGNNADLGTTASDTVALVLTYEENGSTGRMIVHASRMAVEYLWKGGSTNPASAAPKMSLDATNTLRLYDASGDPTITLSPVTGEIKASGGLRLPDDTLVSGISSLRSTALYNATGAKVMEVTAGGAIEFVGGVVISTDDSGNSAVSGAAVFGGSDNHSSEFGAIAAGGEYNHASGYGAAVIGGMMNSATGNFAVALGGSILTASGFESFVGGGEANAATDYMAGVVAGESNIASGYASFIGGGGQGSASGDFASIVGSYDAFAIGSNSFVGGGYGGRAVGVFSAVVGGDEAVAEGLGSFATGIFSLAQSAYSVALGSNNVPQGNATEWIPTDDLFVIGNGDPEEWGVDQKNAIAVHKNGTTRASGVIESKAGIRVPPGGDIPMGSFTGGKNPADLNAGLRYDVE